MKITNCIIITILFFGSCQNKDSQPVQTVVKTVDSLKVAPLKIYDRPTLIFTSTMDTMDIPRSTVSYAYGTLVEKIDTTVTGDFHLLEPFEMQQMKMPKSYIVVGKAFWAGLQVAIAIDSTSKGYVVKRQYQDEGGSGKERFEVVKMFPK